MTTEPAEPPAATTAAPDRGGSVDLSDRRTVIRSVGGSALARFVMLPISAILGIIVTRLIIDFYGEAAFGQYTLLVGLAALIPFADLGLTAAIMNAVAGAGDPRTDDHLRRVLVTCLRVLASCATVVVTVALVLYATGAWPVLLGEGLTPESGSLAATLCLVVFGLNILVAYGQRILAALGLNALVVVLGGLQTPIVLAVLALMIHLGLDGGYIAVASYASTTLICLIAIRIAARRIHPMIGVAIRGAVRIRTVRGARVFDTAWPMLVQMVALPIAMQSDRLVLSQLSSLDELTEYSLASQMFMPILAVVSSAGVALWPVFARARAEGTSGPVSPGGAAVLFAGLAALGSIVIALASGWLAGLASGGAIQIGLPLAVAFSVLIVVQAAKWPFGMYLTDASGLRFQAWFVLGMLPLNLGLSILLTPSLGALGPLIGSIVGVAACQLVPNWAMVARRRRAQA